MDDEVRLLFRELADLTPAERERLLAQRKISSELRAEVESLLAFDSTNGNPFFTACVADAAGEALRAGGDTRVARCGPYRLVRLLGQGGMGAVYLGERVDGELQQSVAVKFLAAGDRRPGWRDRFLTERQILASLNHPSIVRVIDAGHTEDARPYLVMEYVDGIPIDRYAAKLDLRERLRLFLSVCDGVSHAHRRLIVHRDLKPSNILVDASGQPKLLDFGIAKLLESSRDATLTAERLLTPAYASPEQIRGELQTTATDIYSLGAILYKLLTGRSPHESATGTSQAMDIVAGKKAIAPPSALNSDVPTDLDCVVRKALRPEPEERYVSADALAADIRAFLEFRPVEARSGNAWYRTRKFVRRYWVPVAAAALVVASFSTGLWIANRERLIAQRRFSEVRQLANKLFDIDARARDVPGNARTRQLIVDTALEYLGRLSAEVSRDPDLALEVGNAYLQVARVQGVPTSLNLGQSDRAEQSLQLADRFVRPLALSHPPNRMALLRLAEIDADRLILAYLAEQLEQAKVLAREAADLLDRFNAGSNDQAVGSDVLATYARVANEHYRHQDIENAIRLYDRALGIARLLKSEAQVGNLLWIKAQVLQSRGDLDQALSVIQESIRASDPGPGRTAPTAQMVSFVLALNFEGKLLGLDNDISMGRFRAGAEILERSFGIIDEFVHRDPGDQISRSRLADAGVNLGNVLLHFDARRALEIYDHTLLHLGEIKENLAFRRFEASGLAGSSYALRSLGRPAEARQRLDAAFARLRLVKLYPADRIVPGSEAEDTLRARAEYEGGAGHFLRAAEIYQEIIDLTQAAHSRPDTVLSDAFDLSNLYLAQAGWHRRAGQEALASNLDHRRLELWRQWDQKLPHNSFVERQLQAAAPR